MTSPAAVQRRARAGTVALFGCKATFTNEFRRKSHRFQDLLKSLGFTARAATVNGFVVAGHMLTLLVILAGLLWTPGREGLTPLGVPFTTPELASLAAVLLAVALLQSRRRFTRAHRSWAAVSAPLEAGMRSGLILLDAGLAVMLVVQNLRWFEPGNVLAAGSVVTSLVLAVSPIGTRPALLLGVASAMTGAAALATSLLRAPWLAEAGGLGAGVLPQVLLVAAGTAAVAVLTPACYKSTAHTYALRSRGLLIDLSAKSGGVFLLAGAALPIMEVTLWPWTAPFVSIALFFLGLVMFRSSFSRISSPEALGYGLFLVRLAPDHIRPLLFRSLLTSVAMVIPLILVLMLFLFINGYLQAALLLGSLFILETSIDALITQRRTAVLPASHIQQLAQKSKVGLGAALCAGVAVVFSGILGAVTPVPTENPWLGMAAGALVLVAVLLTAIVFTDAPAWLRELSATETEEA
ncbi:hypothetical protein AB0N65_10670 [Paenarthrobacter sp. NPDC089322]|uniref:hypothetical protein n=1 Tax=Paenarthrobacter sp. NPDC089322 TaxID=3155065 RepID=UPI00341AF187